MTSYRCYSLYLLHSCVHDFTKTLPSVAWTRWELIKQRHSLRIFIKKLNDSFQFCRKFCCLEIFGHVDIIIDIQCNERKTRNVTNIWFLTWSYTVRYNMAGPSKEPKNELLCDHCIWYCSEETGQKDSLCRFMPRLISELPPMHTCKNDRS